MAQDSDEDRIRRKAFELWEAEGRPHGRDLDHWEQAREIIATEDSYASTLLPRETGAEEPVEPAVAVESLGDLPNLTDQGKDPLTDVAREPEVTYEPSPAAAFSQPAPAAAPARPAPEAPTAPVKKSASAKTAGRTRKADAVKSKPIDVPDEAPADGKKRKPAKKKR